MGSAATSVRLAFTRHWPGVAMGCCYAVFAVLGVGLAVAPQSASGRPFGVGLAVVYGWLSYRGFRGAAVVVDAAGLRVRGLVRTRRWPAAAVERVSVDVGMVGPYERAFLRVDLREGPPFRFGQFNSAPRERARIDEVAAQVNAFLAGQQSLQG